MENEKESFPFAKSYISSKGKRSRMESFLFKPDRIFCYNCQNKNQHLYALYTKKIVWICLFAIPEATQTASPSHKSI